MTAFGPFGHPTGSPRLASQLVRRWYSLCRRRAVCELNKLSSRARAVFDGTPCTASHCRHGASPGSSRCAADGPPSGPPGETRPGLLQRGQNPWPGHPRRPKPGLCPSQCPAAPNGQRLRQGIDDGTAQVRGPRCVEKQSAFHHLGVGGGGLTHAPANLIPQPLFGNRQQKRVALQNYYLQPGQPTVSNGVKSSTFTLKNPYTFICLRS